LAGPKEENKHQIMSRRGSRVLDEKMADRSISTKVELKNNIISPKNVNVDFSEPNDKKFSTITEKQYLEK
jgi:hypothetical protein